MKLASHRDQDLLDLKFVMKSGKLNVPRARQIVGYYVGGDYATADFDRMLALAIWEKRRRQ
jgi:hypothetical protein